MNTRARDPKDAQAIVATTLKRPVGERPLPALDSPGRQGSPDSPLAGVVTPPAKAARSPRLRRVSSLALQGLSHDRNVSYCPARRSIFANPWYFEYEVAPQKRGALGVHATSPDVHRDALAALANEESLKAAGRSVRGNAGQPLSSEIITSACRSCPDMEKATSSMPLIGEAATNAAESENLCMRRHPKRENREILLVSTGRCIDARRNGRKTPQAVMPA